MISGKELEALPDDPDELLSDLDGARRPLRRTQWRAALHRRIYRWTASAKVIDTRDSHQSESILR